MADIQHIPCHPEQMVPNGMHKHICGNCRFTWAHSDCYSGCEMAVSAHTCPQCGNEQWEKHITRADMDAIILRHYGKDVI